MERIVELVLHSLPLKRWHVVLLLSLTLANFVLNSLSALLTALTSAYSAAHCSGGATAAWSWFASQFI